MDLLPIKGAAYMKLKMIITGVIFLLILTVTGCTNEETAQGIDDEEMRFQGILVGETTYDDLLALDITPLKDIDLNSLVNLTTEPMSGHFLQYEGFDVVAQEKVQSINIYEDYSGSLYGDLHMGDNLDALLSKLPQKPEEYVMKATDETPLQTDKSSAAQIVFYDENDVLQSQIIILYSAEGRTMQFEFDAAEKLKCVRINN